MMETIKNAVNEKNSIPEAVLLSLTEQFLVFPVTLSIMLLARLNGILIAYFVFFFFSFLVIPIYVYIPQRARLPVISGNFLVMVTILILSYGLNLSSAIAVFMGTFFIFRAYWLIQHRNKGYSFYTFIAVGILSYAICALLYSHSASFMPYGGYLAVASTFAVIGGCFGINLIHLGHERLIIDKVSTVPKQTRSSNTYLLSVFGLLILIIASLGFIDQIAALLGYIWRFIKDVYTLISNWYESLFSSNPTQPDLNFTPPMLDDTASSPPSLLSVILSEIGYYLGLAIISLSLAFIIYMSIKKIICFLVFIRRKMAGLFKRFIGIETINAGYNDEVTSLLKDGESMLGATRKWLASNRETNRPYFLLRNNIERVRWLYKRSVRKALERGLALKGTMTSNEVLKKIYSNKESVSKNEADIAVNAYNTARYGDKEPGDSEIELLRDFRQ